ncbi:efflux RND transporter periplasmic adaptor subunit [Aquabacterium sp.]|uniref:efflux RND transporter periplasmic adaptor subunit n=1 Tax=Aquabacterium sp. TaxID=1872578 RepID=UPI00248A6F6B|nr:efflux RND transporter periplasmic adaptor subunit [Aquabacterium sp.]MDI1261523.1 efflux RND transporter periplasmic adaptor subunit [Aquabacterium sp.]
MNASQNRIPSSWMALGRLLSVVACSLGASSWVAAADPGAALKTVTVQRVAGQGAYLADATVEAVRDARLSSQVPGRIIEVLVKAGDRVQAGQVVVRLDQSAAAQQVMGSQAQLAQAQAMLLAAKGDHERAQQLYKKEYLSKAALDHAQAQYKAVEAQARALSAQASGASVQSAYFTIRAPFAGWISQVNVSAGDMALPGVPLLAVYDPAALRLAVQVPESVASSLDVTKPAEIELPNEMDGPRQLLGVRTTVLPSLDASTHSATVRIDIAGPVPPLLPGQFAKVSLPLKARTEGLAPRGQLMVPTASVVERGELTSVYVVTTQGEARLRQVRLGRSSGAQTEVLSGLQPGERVAVDPVAAAQAALR